ARARLFALLAGALPFGSTRRSGGRRHELWVYLVGDPSSPARGVIASIDPEVPFAPRVGFGSVSAFALAAALRASGLVLPPNTGDAPQPTALAKEAARGAFDLARLVLDLLAGNEAAVRRAAKRLALRPLDVPLPMVRGAEGLRGTRGVPGAPKSRPVR